MGRPALPCHSALSLGYKAIAATRYSFNVSRRFRIISERSPDLPDALIHALLEIYKRFIRPQLSLNFLAGNQLSGAASQERQKF